MDWNQMKQNLEEIFDFFKWCRTQYPADEYRPFFNGMYEACNEMREAIQKEDYKALKNIWNCIERSFNDSCPYNDEILYKWYRLKRF